ncbi:MAG: acyltransferase [Agathobacter sp.]|nr:acyltransferase [Agathobacter sp.]
MKLTAQQSNKVQILRGLAIIAVVFIHNTPDGLAQVYFRPFFNFSVGLFLFLSGLLSNASTWSPKKRILKVLIPYVLWTILYTILYNIHQLESIPILLIQNLITAKSAGVMYYIFVYCQFTLLIPLIDRLAKSKYKYYGFFILPVEIVFMRLLPMLIGFEMPSYISTIMSISCFGWFTYFYLGYLLGNGILTIHYSFKSLCTFFILSIFPQIAEGYLQYILGEANCGTQLKLSAALSGILFAMMAYKYILSTKTLNTNINKVFRFLGDISFGIYFSHKAVMGILSLIPYYSKYVIFPFNALAALVATTICVVLGKRILGKYGKYLAL